MSTSYPEGQLNEASAQGLTYNVKPFSLTQITLLAVQLLLN